MHAMKKILPAAILAAFAGAAQAQVSLYGLIDMSYGKNEFEGETQADFHSGGDDFSGQGNSTTRFGIKGSTDVGSGVKANFRMESTGIESDGSMDRNTFFNRQMWLGFSGAFGEVRLGKQDDVPFQAMGEFDFNGSSNAASAQLRSGVAVTGYGLTGRQDRSLQYMSPQFGGFSAHVGFQPESNEVGATQTKDVYSGAIKFAAGSFSAGVSGQTKKSGDPTSEDFASAAASYDFKLVKVMAGYTNAGSNNKGFIVGANAPIAGFNIGAQYGENLEGVKQKATEVWVNREIFKNTYAYFDYGFEEENNAITNPTANIDKETWALGVIYVF